jgi:anhydro-N-acetylmuramic acid kinase
MRELYIGLMSGTSLDGVDGALVDLAGEHPQTIGFTSAPMPVNLRRDLLALQHSGPDELARAAICANQIATIYAQVVNRLIEDAAQSLLNGDTSDESRSSVQCESAAVRQQIRAIGAHGQTIRHQPESGYTLQLLNGSLLSELTGLAVVCDFRGADVAAGGQGAPLVPAFHQAVFSHDSRRRAIINIGGIANLSLLAPGATALGCDSGPGNALMDAWHEMHRGGPFDPDGTWAASGTVDQTLLDRLASEPYFSKPAPKSTGRDLFNLEWLQAALHEPVVPEDVQATLLELTAQSIQAVAASFQADEAYVCGGGARNARLMQRLRELLAPVPVTMTEGLGMDPQSVEAVAFAWLAKCRINKNAGNLPAVTGASGPRILGALYEAPIEQSDGE